MNRLTLEQKKEIHDLIISKLNLGEDLDTLKGALDSKVRAEFLSDGLSPKERLWRWLDLLSEYPVNAEPDGDPLKVFLRRAIDMRERFPEATRLKQIVDSLPCVSNSSTAQAGTVEPPIDRGKPYRERMITASDAELARLRLEIIRALRDWPDDPDLCEMLEKVNAAIAHSRVDHVVKHAPISLQSERRRNWLAIAAAVVILFAVMVYIVFRPTDKLTLDRETLREAAPTQDEASLNQVIQAFLGMKSASDLDLVLTCETFPAKASIASPNCKVTSTIEGVQLIVGGVATNGKARSSLTIDPPALTTRPVGVKVGGGLAKSNHIKLVIGVKLPTNSNLHQLDQLKRREEIKNSIRLESLP